MDLISELSRILNISYQNVKNTVDLLKDDNTIPFIARYRKEATGNLDEVQIREINDSLNKLEALEKRRGSILQSIQSQSRLTDELRAQILQASTRTELEDLYLPYRPKRRTRAMIAREKGLAPLAELILDQVVTTKSMEVIAAPFLSKDVPDLDTALAEAADIVAETISDNAHVRQTVRSKGLNHGVLTSSKRVDAEDQKQRYGLYYQFELLVKYLKPHQILALNRGEHEKILNVNVNFVERDWKTAIHAEFPQNPKSIFYPVLQSAAEDSARRLLLPSIERDIRNTLTDKAEVHAIQVFAQNLKSLLTQPPLDDDTILAIDPGFRTGSKIVVVDPTGKLLEKATIYPHPPQNQLAEARKIVNDLIDKFQVTLVVIGNGTASRESELFVAEITKQKEGINYLITSEAGASVYSASELARQEFPDLDVSVRGAVSIARRVQDPLAELVKIDPKSIGVGLYQHDVNQARLSEALDQVVETVVNAVGVEVNTASAALLTHVAGIGPSLAEKIVQYREENDSFLSRKDLQNVPGMGPKSFEQSAGFLRVRNSENPLDATAIHPESFPIAGQLFELLGLPINADVHKRKTAVDQFKLTQNLDELAELLNTGKPTIEDILDEIVLPGRDPREDLPKPLLRKDVLSMDDLSQGMELMGTIRNVVDFGAFVDIGVKTDGLLHRSKIDRGIQLSVGDIIKVIILTIDQERGRISLGLVEST